MLKGKGWDVLAPVHFLIPQPAEQHQPESDCKDKSQETQLASRHRGPGPSCQQLHQQGDLLPASLAQAAWGRAAPHRITAAISMHYYQNPTRMLLQRRAWVFAPGEQHPYAAAAAFWRQAPAVLSGHVPISALAPLGACSQTHNTRKSHVQRWLCTLLQAMQLHIRRTAFMCRALRGRNR